ncbi:molecular chaperone DnaJ [Candidatus Endowatersipora endosymbiont of Watersipora subatra]|uniref:molecular chaperone DnaJ n=1 Tax=Candidatus Endowatersipora endosymbiont of Watersipora subatra TaxID=3077946 RepID=UPI00312CA437
MSKTDYYDLLGVSRDADEKTLKRAFRKQAMKYHPDKNPGNKEAEAKFKEIGEAYEALKDPQKRAAYDRFGHAAFENAGSATSDHPFSGGSMGDIFEDIFGEMMGGGRRSSSARSRGADIRYNMEISLEEAFTGKTAEIEIPSSITCGSCSGRRTKRGTFPTKCGTCGGVGQVRASQGFFSIQRTCPSCQGQGEVIKDPCPQCSGYGKITENKSISVNIPSGVDDGTRIRLSGEGEFGMRDGPQGDLYIFLSIKPHQFFKRDGSDIYCHVPISMTTAVLGGQFEVGTISGGRTRVKIPEGTQNGKQFRLRSKGMPVMRSSQVGDMYIQVAIEIPQNLTRRQRDLLIEFEKESSADNSPESTGFFSRMKGFFDTLSEG